MPEHWGYESFRSFFGSHIDQEKNKELKRAKTVIEDDNNDGKQSLYERFIHLTADGKHGKDSWSSSDSDEEERLHGEYETALTISQLEEKKGELLNQMELESLVGQKTESEIPLEKEDKKILEDKQNEVELGKTEMLKEELSVRVGNEEGSKQESEHLINKLRYAEYVQRVTAQKLRVAEALLSQKEEENKVLEDTLRGMMFAYGEAQAQVSAEVDEMMTEIDEFYVEFEEYFSYLKSRVNEIANKMKMRRDSDVLRR